MRYTRARKPPGVLQHSRRRKVEQRFCKALFRLYFINEWRIFQEMDKAKIIPLPATLAEFTAYQEQLLGRSMNSNEQEATEKYLEVFNGVAVGKLDADTVIAEIDKALQTNSDPWFQGFMESARFWVLYAAEQRKECFSNGQQV